jgi:hypothetical protein
MSKKERLALARKLFPGFRDATALRALHAMDLVEDDTAFTAMARFHYPGFDAERAVIAFKLFKGNPPFNLNNLSPKRPKN